MKENKEISNFDLGAIDFDIDSRVKFAIAKEEKNGEQKIFFYYGSKLLILRLYIDSKIASTLVVTIKSSEREENETTTLYLQVKKVCEKLAKELGEFSYSFSSTKINMKKWALSKGNEMFDWDDISYLAEEGESLDDKVLICTKKFTNNK